MSAISTTTALLAVTLACAAFSTPLQAQDQPDSAAARVVRTGHLTFDAAVEKVFPLFTPLGEKHWARGWNPKIFYPADGHPVEGLLFYTADHGGMWWWLTRYDPAHHTIEYHAVAPAGLAREIRVKCEAAGNHTNVTVTDTYIGLSEHGNEYVRSLTEAEYAKKMKGWEEPIAQYLKITR